MNAGWYCSQCGRLDSNKIALYREGMFNTHSKRFDPQCTTCGNPAAFHSDGGGLEGYTARLPSKVVVVNGTCASGKTTISYLLSEQYGFVQVDGDWILNKWKTEQKRKIDSNEIHQDLLVMAEGLVLLGKSAVIAHVIPPEFLPLYETFFRARQIDYRIVIFMPQESILLHRNTHRKCWPETTPEYWVIKFYRDFLNAPDDVKAHFYDNSHETAKQTAENLFNML